MNLANGLHFLAILITVVLGALVYRTNPQRTANQVFLVIAAWLVLWSGFLGLGFMSHDPNEALWMIRSCLSVGVFFPLIFEWMRRAITGTPGGWRWMVRNGWLWLLVTTGTALVTLCSPAVVTAARCLPPSTVAAIPEPVYGPAFPFYVAVFMASLGLLIWRFARTIPRHEGIRREELLFILLGAGSSILIAGVLSMLVPLVTGTSQMVRFAPLSVIVLYGTIAYGIATRRIMEVAYFVRVTVAYALLATYLSGMYVFVWWIVGLIVVSFGSSAGLTSHVVAALAVAFSMAPAHGWMQRFTNRLFNHSASLDMGTVIKSANRILQSISTVDTLLAEFSDIVGRSVGTDRVTILMAEKNRFVQRLANPPGAERLSLDADDALVRLLCLTNEPLVPELARRVRATMETANACLTVENLQMAAAVGMRSPERLEGIVLFGPRLSGRIYGAPEQQTLQLLCNQLAVALNNARLYTQVQDGKIYNDILVDSLANGVVAADADGTLTVFNREAQRLTHLTPADVLGHPLHVLPDALASVLATTLREQAGQRDTELALPGPAGEETPMAVSSAIFYGHAGHILGAFLVMNDLSAVKRLEQQVRRSDRLASLGTLAAGMAHEIKNPLVSIKTFTQLMPERYDDADFRDTFFSLVGNEVKRIDSIVNQLLRFSRPAKPNLRPTSLHEILSTTLNLMAQQLRQKNVQLVRRFDAPADLILADGDQLSQAFINLILNAIESMPQGGTLTVATGASTPPAYVRTGDHGNNGDKTQIEVTFSDTGEGIPPEHIAHIFDPFFTTKSQGTGLGLSVAHGIITEHNGSIDVTSDVGRGTSFCLILPLVTMETHS